jgi:hypothetical protein
LAANIDGGMRQSVTYLQRLMMKIGKHHELPLEMAKLRTIVLNPQ